MKIGIRNWISGKSARALVVLIVMPGLAEEKRAWLNGTLIESETRSELIGSAEVESGKTPGIISGGEYSGRKEQQRSYRVWQEYVIETHDLLISAIQPLNWRWSKPAVLTVGGSLRFALEKRNLYISDDTGKEYKCELVRKRAKKVEPETRSSPPK